MGRSIVLSVLSLLAIMLASAPGHVQQALVVRFAAWDPENRCAHVFVTSGARQTVTLTKVAAEAANGGDPTTHELYWSRVRPNPIPPGEVAVATTCIKSAPDADLTVVLATDDGTTLRVPVSMSPPRLFVPYVSCDPALRRANVFLRQAAATEDRIAAVFLDGRDVTGHATRYGDGRFFRGLAAIQIEGNTPFQAGSYHVVGVVTESGERTIEQFRVMRPFFPVGAYGTLSEETYSDLAEHGLNHFTSFGLLPITHLEGLASRRLTAGSSPFADLTDDPTSAHPAEAARQRGAIRAILEQYSATGNLTYAQLFAEPDCRDYYRGQLGSSAGEILRRADLCAQYAPEIPTLVHIDNTFRYDNYRVYAEIPDICTTSRYALGRGDVVGEIDEGLYALRAMAYPRPWYFVPQFFRIVAENGERTGRMPTVGEMELQCYAALANDAKGIIYYCHSGAMTGGEGAGDRRLWDGMVSLHELLERVGGIVAEGTVTDWAECSDDTVSATAIARPPTDVVVVCVNRGARSWPAGLQVPLVRNVSVTVHLPSWLQPQDLLDGLSGTSLAYQVVPEGVRITVRKMHVGAVYIVRTRLAR